MQGFLGRCSNEHSESEERKWALKRAPARVEGVWSRGHGRLEGRGALLGLLRAGTVSRGLTVHALTPAMPGKCSLQSLLLSASAVSPAASSPLPVTHKWLIQGTTDLSSAGPRVYGSHLGVSLRSYRERKPGSLGASG